MSDRRIRWGYVDGMNLYQAFGGNSVNYTDPWGMEAERRLRPAQAPERLKKNPGRKKRLAKKLEKGLEELAEIERKKKRRRKEEVISCAWLEARNESMRVGQQRRRSRARERKRKKIIKQRHQSIHKHTPFSSQCLELEKILTTVEKARREGIRLGYGYGRSGNFWKSITGGWIKGSCSDWSDIVYRHLVKSDNYKHFSYYEVFSWKETTYMPHHFIVLIPEGSKGITRVVRKYTYKHKMVPGGITRWNTIRYELPDDAIIIDIWYNCSSEAYEVTDYISKWLPLSSSGIQRFIKGQNCPKIKTKYLKPTEVDLDKANKK